MSFKTMDGVVVYDKNDTDALLETERGRISSAEDSITNLQTLTQGIDNTKASNTRVQDLENVVGATETTGLRGQVKSVTESNASIESRVTALENSTITVTEINSALNQKADKSYAEQTRGIANGAVEAAAGLATRVSSVENNAVNRSELASEVSNQVDTIITTKLQAITSDINHIVDTEIASELSDYDDSDAVDQKIATAVAAIPNPGVATSADVNAIVNQYF